MRKKDERKSFVLLRSVFYYPYCSINFRNLWTISICFSTNLSSTFFCIIFRWYSNHRKFDSRANSTYTWPWRESSEVKLKSTSFFSYLKFLLDSSVFCDEFSFYLWCAQWESFLRAKPTLNVRRRVLAFSMVAEFSLDIDESHLKNKFHRSFVHRLFSRVFWLTLLHDQRRRAIVERIYSGLVRCFHLLLWRRRKKCDLRIRNNRDLSNWDNFGQFDAHIDRCPIWKPREKFFSLVKEKTVLWHVFSLTSWWISAIVTFLFLFRATSLHKSRFSCEHQRWVFSPSTILRDFVRRIEIPDF